MPPGSEAVAGCQELLNTQRVSVAVNTATNSTPKHREDCPEPESPLSRFQKHVRSQASRSSTSFQHSSGKNASCLSSLSACTTKQDAPTKTPIDLNRSLKEKIEEAKRLRQVEEARHQPRHSTNQARAVVLQPPVSLDSIQQRQTDPRSPRLQSRNASTALLQSQMETKPETPQLSVDMPAAVNDPPVPHPKPVIPALPPLESRVHSSGLPVKEILATEQALEQKSGKFTNLAQGNVAVDSIIIAANAVVAIQRTWRKWHLKQTSKGFNDESEADHGAQVQLVIDRDRKEQAITPLFRFPRQTKPDLRTNDQEQNAIHSILGDGDVQISEASEDHTGAELVTRSDCHISHHPWTDHDLIFMEEGRLIGELEEAVRSGKIIDDSEVLWKRPQLVIENIEKQRVSLIRKTRRLRATNAGKLGSFLFAGNKRDDQVQMTKTSPSVEEETGVTLSASRKQRSKRCRLPRVRMRKRRRAQKQIKLNHSAKASGEPPEQSSGEYCPQEKPSDTSESLAQEIGLNSDAHDGGSANVSIEEAAIEMVPVEDHRNDCLRETRIVPFQAARHNFVFFQDVTTSGEVDGASRNDLITVGDLTIAARLLSDEHRRGNVSTENNVLARRNEFIPLSFSTHAASSTVVDDRNDHISEGWTSLNEGQCCSSTVADVADGCKPSGDHGMAHSERIRINECSGADNFMQHTRRSQDFFSLESSSAILPDNQRSHDWRVDLDEHSCCGSDSDNALFALKAMQGTVADTMTKLHELRNEFIHQDQPLPPRNDSVELIAQTAAKPRLDEDKRLEFLRVLDDFKRCLRPSSSTHTSNNSSCSSQAEPDMQSKHDRVDERPSPMSHVTRHR